MDSRNDGLAALVAPRSVCVVGASPRAGHFANTPLRNLLAYGRTEGVYPVNPRHEQVEGLRCFPSVSDLPEIPDLAVVVVRPDDAVEVVRECAELGVGAAVVVGSGFAETGDADGRRLQGELRDIAAGSGLRILGPNTLGVANYVERVVPFASGNVVPVERPGRLAVVSQSGGCSFTLVNRAVAAGIGVGHVAVAGNEVDVTIPDLLRYYLGRGDVSAVCCYIEAVRDPDGLREAAALAAAAGKPLFVMRSGTSERGERAALAHTGALATDDAVFDAALTQWGVGRAQTFDELVFAGALAARYGPGGRPRLGVYAQGGGVAVVASDLLSAAGVELATLAPATVDALKTLMPDTTPGNPFDSGGQFLAQGAAPLVEALHHLDRDPGVDALAYFLMPVLGSRAETYTSGLEQAVASTVKPSVVLQYGAGDATGASKARLLEAGALVFDPPEAAVRALRLWSDAGRPAAGTAASAPPSGDRSERTPARALVERWRASGDRFVSEHQAGELLRRYGIDTARQVLVAAGGGSPHDLPADLSPPLVVKVSSPDIAHRSDIGAVVLDLPSLDAAVAAADVVVERARAAHPEARIDGAQVGEMVDGDIELLVGGRIDKVFGPVVVVSMGGIHAEAFGSPVVALPGLTEHQLESRLFATPWGVVVAGARGRQPFPVAALHDVVTRLGQLLTDLCDLVVAVEMNPLLWSAARSRAVAADALIELRAPERG